MAIQCAQSQLINYLQAHAVQFCLGVPVNRTNLGSKPDRGPRPRSVCPGVVTNGARPALVEYSHERLLVTVRNVITQRQQRNRHCFEPVRAEQIFCCVHSRPRFIHLTSSAELHSVGVLPVHLICKCAPHNGESLHQRLPFDSGAIQPDVCTDPSSPVTRSHDLAVWKRMRHACRSQPAQSRSFYYFTFTRSHFR